MTRYAPIAQGVSPLEPPAPASEAHALPVADAPRHRGPPRAVLIVLALAAAGGAAWAFGLLDARKLGTVLPWRVERARDVLTLHGNVDIRQVDLSFKVGGRIARLAVDEGDAVEAGALLAELDRRYFEDELRLARARREAKAAALARLEHGTRPEEIAQARALVAEREASLARVELSLRRSAQLLARNAATRQELDEVEAAARVARAQLESAREALRLAEVGPRVEDIDAARAELAAAEAELTQAERRFEDARLVAPGAGVILTRAREAGAIVQPGETVLTLTLASPVWVRTYVAEPDLGRVRPGVPVEVRTDGAPSRPYRGRVGYISPTAEFTPKTVETEELRTRLVYRVRIVVEDPDGGLRQGMPVTVRVPIASEGGSG
jgi:HlyD family secretion protein